MKNTKQILIVNIQLFIDILKFSSGKQETTLRVSNFNKSLEMTFILTLYISDVQYDSHKPHVASGHLFCGYSKSFEAKNISFSKESRNHFY